MEFFNAILVGGCREKPADIGLSWWDSIEVVASIKLDNQGAPKSWDVTKWELGGVGRIAVITYELPIVRVYKACSPNSSEGNVTLKEEYKITESDTYSVVINDVAIHANMLVYSTTNIDTSQNYLKVVNISSSLEQHAWKLQLPSTIEKVE